MAAVVAGSTGLVGSNILSTLLAHSKFPTVSAFARRPLPSDSSKLTTLEDKDSEKWPSQFPAAKFFFSALGTTRAQAGGLEQQRKIDYDLNLALAKAAKEAGVDTYVLISSAGSSPTSMMPYSKMKGELEQDVQKIGFKNTVILRPGLIMGTREDSRPSEFALRKFADMLGKVTTGMVDFWAQDANVIAKAAVNAALQCESGKKEAGVWIMSQHDIVRLGRTEWTEEKPSA